MQPRERPRIRLRLVGAVTLASWVAASLFLTVTPVLALSATCGVVTLSQGGVSPASGTPATTFTFTVTYTNANGGTPSRARVRFGDFSEVVLTGAGDTKAGVTYTGSTTKPNGTWTYKFRFRTNGTWCETPTGTFIVATATPPTDPEADGQADAEADAEADRPKPTPKPTPKATPKPTPKPRKAVATPKPSRKPRPSAKPAASPVRDGGRAVSRRPSHRAMRRRHRPARHHPRHRTRGCDRPWHEWFARPAPVRRSTLPACRARSAGSS